MRKTKENVTNPDADPFYLQLIEPKYHFQSYKRKEVKRKKKEKINLKKK